jgi:hypothetical protein
MGADLMPGGFDLSNQFRVKQSPFANPDREKERRYSAEFRR